MQLELVDSHVHFWDRTRLAYGWLDEFPAIAGVHTPAELRAESSDFPAETLVFVECNGDPDAGLDELGWLEALAARDPRIQALVAFVEVDRGARSLARLDEVVMRPLVRGIRHSLQDHADPEFCLRPAFVDGVRACGERELSFDLCVRHPQLLAVTELARRCPKTTFILDHGGKPDIKNALLDPWRAHVRELARLPNVVCKLSGLVTEADPRTWTVEALRPYAEHLLACFGAERLLFGSDWPVVKLAASYERWLHAALSLLEPLPAAARTAVLSGNARRVYRLP
jgi:L-fuconolactonase